MDDWLTKAATTLGVDAIDDAAQERLLEAARDVAHGVERKLTPLATYLLGVAVERRVGAGEDRESAFSAAVADLERAIDADHDV
ncbi:MAG TPA: DUF6457 domain-containing protein [Actinomycetota bacterium]|nr:DUF6457 domain-containing protein [Actinomycetota bacterium]